MQRERRRPAVNCKDVEDYIVPYIELELSPAMQTWMTEHLHDCAQCSERHTRLRQFDMPQIPEPTVEQLIRMRHTLDRALNTEFQRHPKSPKRRHLPATVLQNAAPIALLVFLILGLGAWDAMDGLSADKYPSSASAGIVTPDKHWF